MDDVDVVAGQEHHPKGPEPPQQQSDEGSEGPPRVEEVPTITLETRARGQPQETPTSTVFHVLRSENEEGSAPRAVFIEASNRSTATHSAIADLARQLFNSNSRPQPTATGRPRSKKAD